MAGYRITNSVAESNRPNTDPRSRAARRTQHSRVPSGLAHSASSGSAARVYALDGLSQHAAPQFPK